MTDGLQRDTNKHVLSKEYLVKQKNLTGAVSTNVTGSSRIYIRNIVASEKTDPIAQLSLSDPVSSSPVTQFSSWKLLPMFRCKFNPLQLGKQWSKGSCLKENKVREETLCCYVYSRSLCTCGVLLEFTVVDGEVWPKVTTVTQRRDTAAKKEEEKAQ